MQRTYKGFAGILILLISVLIIGILGTVYFVITKQTKNINKQSFSLSITPTQTTLKEADEDLKILEDLPISFPEVKWGEIIQSENYGNPVLVGLSRSGTYFADENFNRFGNTDLLSQLGWSEVNPGGADFPGGAMWEYSKNISGKKRLIRYSYLNKSIKQNNEGTPTLKCPCTYQLDVFLSNPF